MSIDKQYCCPDCEEMHDSPKQATECCLPINYICPICGSNWDNEGSAIMCCANTIKAIYVCSECENIFHEPIDGQCPVCGEG